MLPWQQPQHWHSRLRATDLVLPIGAMIGVTERRRRIDRTEWDDTLNGTSIALRPLYGRKYGVTFSASGPAVRWTPTFAALPLDAWFQADCTLHLTDPLYLGQSQTVLHRDPVPGTVAAFRALDPEETPVPVDVAGRVVTLSGGAVADADLVVRYLPRLRLCLVNDEAGGPEIEGRVEWSLETREYQPG